MSAGSPTTAESRSPDFVFVVGAPESGLELLAEILTHLGMRPLSDLTGFDRDRLSALNDSLLVRAHGSRDLLPPMSPQGFGRVVAPWEEEIGDLRDTFAAEAGGGGLLFWADPALSLLAPYWQRALGVEATTLFIHGPPSLAAVPSGWSADQFTARWARYNRSALMLAFEWPSYILSDDQLRTRTQSLLDDLKRFLELRLQTPLKGSVEDTAEWLKASQYESISQVTEVSRRQMILAKVLDELDGPHAELEDSPSPDQLTPVLEAFYDDDYYGADYDQSGVPYDRSENMWTQRFASVARGIAQSLAPITTLDVGCASGMLVEALRELKIDARGIDISRAAIDQVPPSLRGYCTLGSIFDEFGSHYDLIVCTEVLEHLPPFAAKAAIANLCRHSDIILFSSTPDDFSEPTHLNVRTGDYWAHLFLRHGFVRDGTVDASFLAPHAAVFKRREHIDQMTLVEDYELALDNVASALGSHLHAALSQYEDLERRFGVLERRERDLEAHYDAVAGFETLRRNEIAFRRLGHFLSVRTDEVAARDAEIAARDAEIAALLNTKLFRYSDRIRRVYGWIRNQSSPSPEEASPQLEERPFGPTYQQWIGEFERMDAQERAELLAQVAQITQPPLISLIMPVFDPSLDFLHAAIESTLAQIYENWELCIADDCSTNPEIAAALKQYADADPRIKIVFRAGNGHISAASNSALELCTGQWIGCLDHDDVLPPHALAISARQIAHNPKVGILYSDDDKIDSAGVRYGPYFKPDFDRSLLLGQNFLAHLCLYRRDLVDAVGGFRLGFEGSQDWDLALRVAECLSDEQILHVPHILYHWRSHEKSAASSVAAKPYAAKAGLLAVRDHVSRVGLPATVTAIAEIGHNRVTWDVPDPPRSVSVVVLATGSPSLMRCIQRIAETKSYPNFEVVIASQGELTDEQERSLSAQGNVEVIRHGAQSSLGSLLNSTIQKTASASVCLVSDRCIVDSDHWLSELVGHLERPRVGAVGGKLLLPGGRVGHAGFTLGVEGIAFPTHRGVAGASMGYFGRLIIAHQVAAVSKEFMLIQRAAWDEVGGFDAANVPECFIDVDLCLRLKDAGWKTMWTPYAEATQSVADMGSNAERHACPGYSSEAAYMRARWGPEIMNDPSYNPNLTLNGGDFSPGWPPRVKLP